MVGVSVAHVNTHFFTISYIAKMHLTQIPEGYKQSKTVFR